MKYFRLLLNFIVFAFMVFALVFASLLLVAGIKNYKPPAYEVIVRNEAADTLSFTDTLKVLSWNIGYCGLGDEMDFFYDGGQTVRCSADSLHANIGLLKQYINEIKNIDFWLFQEVDQQSKRSYFTNQITIIDSLLHAPSIVFATNYNVFFVPMPMQQPYGKVLSGLLTVASQRPLIAARHAFPGNYKWPKSLFMLDRCFLVKRYPVDDGRELLVINTHNSAYDNGTLKQLQTEYLKNFVSTEYEKGNYIMVGGDWNQCPPQFTPGYTNQPFDTLLLSYIPTTYLPGWQWAYDNETPTNRRVDKPYKKGVSRTTVIDFYLLSPNLKALDVNTLDINFNSSDHQPVILKFSFK